MILVSAGLIGHHFLAFVYPPEHQAKSILRIFTLDLVISKGSTAAQIRLGGPGESLRGAIDRVGEKYTINSMVRMHKISMNAVFFAAEIILPRFVHYRERRTSAAKKDG